MVQRLVSLGTVAVGSMSQKRRGPSLWGVTVTARMTDCILDPPERNVEDEIMVMK